MQQTSANTLIVFVFLSVFLTITSQSAFGQQDNWSRIDRDPQQMDKFQGYYNQTELNIGTGLGEVDPGYSKGFGGVTTVNGYRFNESLQAGVGVGYLKYDAGGVLPLYLDGRYYLLKKRNKVFAGGAGGYLVSLSGDDFRNAPYVNPMVGMEVPLKNRSSLSFSAGVMTQWQKDYRRDTFVNFKVGVVLW